MSTVTASRRADNTAPELAERLSERLAGIDREHLPWLSAIAAAPNDNLPRLVYADWLEERGQWERAALIRAQCPREGGSGRVNVGSALAEGSQSQANTPAHGPAAYRFAKGYTATVFPPGRPLGTRHSGKHLYVWRDGCFNRTREVKSDLYLWLAEEVKREHQQQLADWERRGRIDKLPMRRKVTGSLINSVYAEIRGLHPEEAGPYDLHLGLMGWDQDLGVHRPTEPIPPGGKTKVFFPPFPVATSRPGGPLFERGFAAVGSFNWPPTWEFEQVVAVFARQPVDLVTLSCGQSYRWIKRGEPDRLTLDGSLPADAFDIAAQLSPSRLTERRGCQRLEFGSLEEKNQCVDAVEALVNDVIRAWRQPNDTSSAGPSSPLPRTRTLEVARR